MSVIKGSHRITITKKVFTILSFTPLAWILSVYFFTVLCWIKLGHFPIPSLDDPKSVGPLYFHYLTWILFFAAFYSVGLWLILLPNMIKSKLLEIKNVVIMCSGIVIAFIQLKFDPFLIIYWLLD